MADCGQTSPRSAKSSDLEPPEVVADCVQPASVAELNQLLMDILMKVAREETESRAAKARIAERFRAFFGLSENQAHEAYEAQVREGSVAGWEESQS